MDKKKIRRKGLGRGLSTLLVDPSFTIGRSIKKDEIAQKSTRLFLPIEKIQQNEDQPRKIFEKSKLEELSLSILKNGILQPIIVRKKGDFYQIVAGERRWRAAQLANLHEVPVILLELSDMQVLEYSIIENIQREDLNVVEEAYSLKQLMEKFDHKQDDLANSLGKSRSYIANILRLLTLPEIVLDYLKSGQISTGHARAIIGLDNASSIARQIITSGFSVRQTENLVKKQKNADSKKEEKQVYNRKDVDTINLERTLSAQTKFKITIEHNKTGTNGRLIFNYRNLEELDDMCNYFYSN